MDNINWAKVWCKLNRFEFPKEFGKTPVWWDIDGIRTRNFTNGAMATISLLVLPKELAREWNSQWSDEKFNAIWDAQDEFRAAWGHEG